MSLGINRQEGTFSRTQWEESHRQAAVRAVVSLAAGPALIRSLTVTSFLLRFLPWISRASQKRDGRGLAACSLWVSLGTLSRAECGWWIWKAKRCAAHRKSLHSQMSWLFLCFTSHHSRVCNLLLLKAASTWNHFLVCLLARNFSQLFYLFETCPLPVSFFLKSGYTYLESPICSSNLCRRVRSCRPASSQSSLLFVRLLGNRTVLVKDTFPSHSVALGLQTS